MNKAGLTAVLVVLLVLLVQGATVATVYFALRTDSQSLSN